MNSQRLTLFLLSGIAVFFIGLHLAKIGKLWGPAFMGTSANFFRSDRPGEPVGADFSYLYAASNLALSGKAVGVYDLSKLQNAERTIFHTQMNLPWHYPPSFLLIILPLSLVPFLPALLLWLLSTLALYLIAIYRNAPHPLTPWLTLAFPGTFVNFICGQNGFLSAAILSGGLALLDNYPLIGGLVLGLMSYKPHLAWLIPLALLAGRQWRGLVGASISGLGLVLMSASAFGFESWQVFFESIPLTMQRFAESNPPWGRMPTVYAAVQSLGGGAAVAGALQGVVTAVVAAVVCWIWFKKSAPALRNAVLGLGVVLCSFYAMNYDLAMLALPLACLGWEGYKKGWLPFEPCALMLAWATPMFLLPVRTKIFNLPISPLILLTLLFFIVWRDRLSYQ
jgi:hypothetical protein